MLLTRPCWPAWKVSPLYEFSCVLASKRVAPRANIVLAPITWRHIDPMQTLTVSSAILYFAVHCTKLWRFSTCGCLVPRYRLFLPAAYIPSGPWRLESPIYPYASNSGASVILSYCSVCFSLHCVLNPSQISTVIPKSHHLGVILVWHEQNPALRLVLSKHLPDYGVICNISRSRYSFVEPTLRIFNSDI